MWLFCRFMAREKALSRKGESDESEDEPGCTKVGIFHHKIKRFKRKKPGLADRDGSGEDDTEKDDDSDDDDDFKLPVKRKRGRYVYSEARCVAFGLLIGGRMLNT